MRLAAAILLLSAGAAEAAERWFPPRLWLRAIAEDASAVIVEPQSGFWPEGMWLEVNLDGAVRELPPPDDCLWTSMAISPRAGRRAAAAFCPARACRDSISLLAIDGVVAWEARGRHLASLVWRADGVAVGGVLSLYRGERARGLGSLGRGETCLRTPLGVAEFGAGDIVSRLPALLPSVASGLWLAGHDDGGWLAEIGYANGARFVSHPPVAAMLDAWCAANPAPEFGRPCGAAGHVLVRLKGDTAEAVALGGGPVTSRALPGPGFFVSETCEVERLPGHRFNIRSRCDLLRWDPPFDRPTRLTTGGAVLGGLALSGDGRMIAALNPFAGAESSLTLIDAETGAARDVPISDWVRDAFRATGRVSQVGDEE